ncbi:unnamed protein product [Schistosoma turkestanicum]|nr:unnamed protein product [Schistosoma turkestanicum]
MLTTYPRNIWQKCQKHHHHHHHNITQFFIELFIILTYCTRLHLTNYLYVEFPLTMLTARRLFGIPVTERYLELIKFSHWKTKWPKEISWKYLKMANYEIPLYVKEGHWLPDAMLSICIPEATHKNFMDMAYEFTHEESQKRYTMSIRHHFTFRKQYYTRGYLIILSFLINLCQCRRNINPEIFCPNPCTKPNVCHDDVHSNGVCTIRSNEQLLNDFPPMTVKKLSSIYTFDYECVCLNEYTFNKTLKKCVPVQKHCDSSICLNNGECEYLTEKQRIIPNIEFMCKCPPAWKGLACEEPRNPCLEAPGLCGRHYCYRDPTNLKLGYRCQCPIGFKVTSATNPKCTNINECIEYTNDDACLNGGICIDQEPNSTFIDGVMKVTAGFQCICRSGYYGQRCEHISPPLEWTIWSEWSECSVTCGVGVHKRFRNCSLPNRCVGGSYVQVRKCRGSVLFCGNEKIDDSIESGGSNILESLNTTEWHDYNNYSINHTFSWNNLQFTGENLDLLHSGISNTTTGNWLEWISTLQLTKQWTMTGLIITYTIINMLLYTPVYLIIVCLNKFIQFILNKIKQTKNV